MGAGIKPESLEGMSAPNHWAVSLVPQYYYLGTNTFNSQGGFNSVCQVNLCVGIAFLLLGPNTRQKPREEWFYTWLMVLGDSPSGQKSHPAFAVKRS